MISQIKHLKKYKPKWFEWPISMLFAEHLFMKIEKLWPFALYQGRAIIIVNYYLLLLINNIIIIMFLLEAKLFSAQLLI